MGLLRDSLSYETGGPASKFLVSDPDKAQTLGWGRRWQMIPLRGLQAVFNGVFGDVPSPYGDHGGDQIADHVVAKGLGPDVEAKHWLSGGAHGPFVRDPLPVH